ncbi:uncharacterized protein LOC112513385 [Cynara cardunculus var. scolymus]|uniref:uncharacterized protein LOC112513385 n=1 Tax=Cynara cardunculus var. scolymus TaxID=59895 RepID=UPI000D631160|nr:uncharacterized protein LOC112513385 [Cynara cardunculus var. scolymus]
MLENPVGSSSSTANISAVKRYAPPNQRNRSLGRRKSGGDGLERANIYVNDGDKNQVAALRNVPILDRPDPQRLIALEGCCNSEAYQLLNNRWAAAMNSYENPSTDIAERPVMYSGSGASSGVQIGFPYQMIPATSGVGPSGHQIDFLSELRLAMHNSNASSDK